MEAKIFFVIRLNSKLGLGVLPCKAAVGWRGVGCATVHLLGRLLSFGLLPCEAGNPARRVVSLLHFPV